VTDDEADGAKDAPPDLGAAGAAMREEWRAEQEAATQDAVEQWRHARTLLDIARDHMHRGDHVAIVAGGHRVAGVIIEVARDRIAVFDAPHDARVDVQVAESVPFALTVVELARAGGRSGAQAASFRARLLELEAAGEPVTIAATFGPDRVTGTLSVGVDVVMIATAVGETVIALAAVATVAPAG
jgi:hypothetical protein